MKVFGKKMEKNCHFLEFNFYLKKNNEWRKCLATIFLFIRSLEVLRIKPQNKLTKTVAVIMRPKKK